MGRKIIVWRLQATNKRNIIQENQDRVKKRNSQKKNWISSDNSTKQRHKDELCQSKNRQDAKKQQIKIMWW